MNKAEEFYKEYFRAEWFHPKDKHDKLIPKIDYYGVIEIMEAYHQSRVNAISSNDYVRAKMFVVHKTKEELVEDNINLIQAINLLQSFKEQLLNKTPNCTSCGISTEKRGGDYWCRECHNEM